MEKSSLVVCVNTEFPKLKSTSLNYPKKDVIYTVREILNIKGRTGLLLEEIQNALHPSGIEFGFLIGRFVEIQPPISILDVFEIETLQLNK